MAGCGAPEAGAEPAAGLVVREELPPMPLHVEGSLSFLRVDGPGGEVVFDGPATDGMQVRGRDPLLERSLPAGEYRIVSHQRPCQGNCSYLDPPTDRCERTVRLEPGATLTATVVLAQQGGCQIRPG
jgi:hypothetical protein